MERGPEEVVETEMGEREKEGGTLLVICSRAGGESPRGCAKSRTTMNSWKERGMGDGERRDRGGRGKESKRKRE